MIKTLRLARLFLVSPAKAARACLDKAALGQSLKIYGLTLAAAAVFFRLKPYDFPDANAAVPSSSQGIFFWLKVLLWQPVLMAALIGFCGALLRWTRDGWLPLKVASSFLWAAVPLILTVLYVKNAIPKAAFALILAVWACPGVYVARALSMREWEVLA
ncbi:MAG: hypothetical protein HYZ74_07985, partial [Elusimicrobia bacterium]|nr:hypothetical protein [Elusimicrobiota bacterium]